MRPESVDPGKENAYLREKDNGFASMRPESVDPGKLDGFLFRPDAQPASMRPESVDPGKNVGDGLFRAGVRLQ